MNARKREKCVNQQTFHPGKQEAVSSFFSLSGVILPTSGPNFVWAGMFSFVHTPIKEHTYIHVSNEKQI